jgi:hypothetical protein
MTLKIGIGLSFYEDFDSLRRMLMSCQQYPIDKIIAIDGRYEGYPTKNDHSHKDVLDLFDAFQTRVELFDLVANQNSKRQLYFDMAKNLDIIIVMDSDEYFLPDKTNWPLFVEDLEDKVKANAHTYKQAYCLPVYLLDKGVQKMPEDYYENLPRIFHRPTELQYVDDHFSIRNKKTGVLMSFEGNSIVQHIAMGHDHNLRSKQYNANTKKYEDELVEYENSIRDKRRTDFSNNMYKQNHS